MCVRGVGVAAEVISLGVRLDHIPVFSCCGWGWRERRGGGGRHTEELGGGC